MSNEPDNLRVSDELDLIVAVLRGYRDSPAKADAMRAVGVIRAAQAKQPAAKQCPGIPRKGCGYLATCDSVCNKCGQIHRSHQLVAEQPAPVMANGLTEAETGVTASVAGLMPAAPAVLTDADIDAIIAKTHDGKVYPQSGTTMPKVMRRVEARAILAAAIPPGCVVVKDEPVGWQHSATGKLYESEADVPLADGDEWAEPLYAARPGGGK